MKSNSLLNNLLNQSSCTTAQTHPFCISDYPEDPSNTIYVALDLHKNNAVVCVATTEEGTSLTPRYQELFLEQVPTLGKKNVLKFEELLASYIEGKPHRITCESTYNWYWLADMCERRGWRFCLCDPSTVSKANNKYANDFTDASYLCKLFWLRELHICQVGYHNDRATRDLVRRRQDFIQERARLKTMIRNKLVNHLSENLSYDSLVKKVDLENLDCNEVLAQLASMLGDDLLAEDIQMQLEQIRLFNNQIQRIEQRLDVILKHKPELKEPMTLIQTINGAGPVLSSIIMTEIMDITRFETAKDFSSYARLAPTTKLSNGKIKGVGNAKNGNPYLSWALTELAYLATRHSSAAKRYYNRKLKSQGLRVMALRSTALKLAKAIFVMLTTGQPFDEKKVFG